MTNRRVLWTIPISSAFLALPLFAWQLQQQPDPQQAAAYAAYVTAPNYEFWAGTLIAGLVCLLLSVIALHVTLRDTSGARWAGAGMVLGVVGLSLSIGLWLIMAVATPTLGDLYRSGHTEVGPTFQALSSSARQGVVFIGRSALLIGSAVCFGVAIWRSRKWWGVLFGIGFVFANTFGGIAIMGTVALAASGVALARSADRREAQRLWATLDRAIAIQPANRLLVCGLVGPLIFVGVFLVDGAVQPGYSAISDYVSDLSRGSGGWAQIGNFILFGLLMVLFAAGVRASLRGTSGGEAGPVLLALMGISAIAAGVFVGDPSTWHGGLHQTVSIVANLCLAAVCFVFTNRFARERKWGSAVGSSIVGVLVIVLFTASTFDTIVALGIAGLVQRTMIVLGFGWIALLALHLLRQQRILAIRADNQAAVAAKV